jgi:hypothetical protein
VLRSLPFPLSSHRQVSKSSPPLPPTKASTILHAPLYIVRVLAFHFNHVRWSLCMHVPPWSSVSLKNAYQCCPISPFLSHSLSLLHLSHRPTKMVFVLGPDYPSQLPRSLTSIPLPSIITPLLLSVPPLFSTITRWLPLLLMPPPSPSYLVPIPDMFPH